MDINKYSFEKKDSYIDKTTGIEVFKLYNFTTISNNNIIHMPGKYFAIKFGVHYGHLLLDYLGPFLYLKKQYPDLKLVFFKYEDSDIYLTTNKPSEDIAKYFDAPILDVNKNSYIFDEFIIMYKEDLEVTGNQGLFIKDKNAKPNIPIIPSNLFLDNFYHVEDDSSESYRYKKAMVESLCDEFLKYREEKDLYNKIYITRPTDKLVDFNDDSKRYWNYRRYRDEIYYNRLEEELQRQGYKIINLYDLGFFDQINLFYNAKQILLIEGTALMNAIWCKGDTQIIRILISKNYRYDWDYFVKCSGDHIMDVIDVRNLQPEDGFNKIIKNSLIN